jgi:uncharacterized NAD(P)/FAD-binding protein YdhS
VDSTGQTIDFLLMAKRDISSRSLSTTLGHRGRIIAVSRRGIFPNRHDDYIPLSSTAIPSDTPPTCVAYLHALRAAIREGAEWRVAIDSLRETTNELWLRLPIEEKSTVARNGYGAIGSANTSAFDGAELRSLSTIPGR